jgi:uncharacterized protein DUF4388
MSLSGDLHTMDLADVLEWIASHNKTGLLTLEHRATRKFVVVRGGVLRSGRSNLPRDTLGQYLVRDAFISEDELFQTLLRQEQAQDKRRLGVMLAEEGRVVPEDITRLVRECLAESLYDAFLWREGRFEFRDEKEPQETPFEVALDLAMLIREGQRRRMQWERIKSVGAPDTRFRAVGQLQDLTDPQERTVFGLAAAGKTLGEISLRRRRPEFETAFILHALCQRKLLAAENPADPEAAPDPVAAIAAHLEIAGQRMDEGRYDAAFDAYESVLALDRLNQDAKKGLLAVSDARRKARVKQRVPMEAVPVLKVTAAVLTQQSFDPQEGFLLSRINGEWNVQTLLKVCPLPEDDVIAILGRLLERKVIALQ